MIWDFNIIYLFTDIWSWVVCDGDIDPEWIEALNSVLDDNRLLTLPSGWRIQFGNKVNFLFETHSLEHASPATVSRMGIILLRYVLYLNLVTCQFTVNSCLLLGSHLTITWLLISAYTPNKNVRTQIRVYLGAYNYYFYNYILNMFFKNE